LVPRAFEGARRAIVEAGAALGAGKHVYLVAPWQSGVSSITRAFGAILHLPRAHRGKGLLGITLRYPYEVRKEDEYFEDIPDEKIPKDMLELASHIVETKSGHFEPEKFEDQYEDALKELLKKKQAGEKIEAPKERAPAKVINLMDALRRSVEAERGGSAKRQAQPAKARGSESERKKKSR
jgi:DNA end-binding protein Ku